MIVVPPGDVVSEETLVVKLAGDNVDEIPESRDGAKLALKKRHIYQ